MSLELLTTPLDKFKIVFKLLQTVNAAYHKFSVYGNKNKSPCMVNSTNMSIL